MTLTTELTVKMNQQYIGEVTSQ